MPRWRCRDQSCSQMIDLELLPFWSSDWSYTCAEILLDDVTLVRTRWERVMNFTPCKHYCITLNPSVIPFIAEFCFQSYPYHAGHISPTDRNIARKHFYKGGIKSSAAPFLYNCVTCYLSIFFRESHFITVLALKIASSIAQLVEHPLRRR